MSVMALSTTFTQCAPETIKFGKIIQYNTIQYNTGTISNLYSAAIQLVQER